VLRAGVQLESSWLCIDSVKETQPERPVGRTGIVSVNIIMGPSKIMWSRIATLPNHRAATLDSAHTGEVEMALKRKATEGATAAAQKKARTGIQPTNDVVPTANNAQ
jgi:hypothetical protein